MRSLQAAVGLMLAGSILVGAPPASGGGRAPTAAPHWSLVWTHWDRGSGDPYSSGLDVLSSDDPRPRALVRLRAPRETAPLDPIWAPDARHVAFVREEHYTGLYVVASDGGAARLLVRGSVESPVWSPDGSRIAFSHSCIGGDMGCRKGIYVAFLDGSRPRRVLPQTAVMSTPDCEQDLAALSWSPDGRSLLAYSGWLKPARIIAVDGSGSSVLRLPGSGLGPAYWSRDGTLIAFERRCTPVRGWHDYYCDIGFVTPAGGPSTRPHRPLQAWMDDRPPVWTTDGRLLLLRDYASPALIDPATSATRTLGRGYASGLAAGPNGAVGYLRGDERLTLVIQDRNGNILVHRRIAAVEPDGALLIR
jgi:hypothetical protein